jgi:site-specific recombinase XerD
VQDRFRAALEEAGLGDCAGPRRRHHLPLLRHVPGKQMAMAGVPLRSIQAWLGHANFQTTEGYAAYAPDASNGRNLAQEAFASRTRQDDAG